MFLAFCRKNSGETVRLLAALMTLVIVAVDVVCHVRATHLHTHTRNIHTFSPGIHTSDNGAVRSALNNINHTHCGTLRHTSRCHLASDVTRGPAFLSGISLPWPPLTYPREWVWIWVWVWVGEWDWIRIVRSGVGILSICLLPLCFFYTLINGIWSDLDFGVCHAQHTPNISHMAMQLSSYSVVEYMYVNCTHSDSVVANFN